MATNFSTIDAQCFQVPNPGGLRRVLVAVSRSFTAPWPTVELIDADGSITALPTLKQGEKFAEYMFPDATASVDSDGNGDPGFQSYKHAIEVGLAGFSKEVRKEVRKHLNAGSVWIMEMKDGQFVVAGSSDDPVFLKPSFKGGKKGSDKRGYTFKGDADGMMWDLPVIKPTLIAQLEIAPLVEPAP